MTDIFDEEKTHQETESTKTESQCPGGQTKQKRSQLLGELYRVRKEMINNSTIVSKPEVLKCMYTGCERNFLQGRDNATRVEGIDGSIACNLCITVSDLGARSRKPYTPDVFNDLSPYYNKFVIDYMINDQIDYVPRPGWGTRATSLRLVDPDVSWRMDHFPGPVYDSVVPRGFYKPQIWSKNVPGKDDAQGSTRLPPIPKVTYPRFQQKQYQHFNMDYSHVQPFRRDIERLKETKAQRRMKEDQTRTLNDWNRMNLAELKTLPLQSRFHVKKAITSYLGTSKGCNKALRPLLDELNTYERLVQPEKA